MTVTHVYRSIINLHASIIHLKPSTSSFPDNFSTSSRHALYLQIQHNTSIIIPKLTQILTRSVNEFLQEAVQREIGGGINKYKNTKNFEFTKNICYLNLINLGVPNFGPFLSRLDTSN